MNNKKTSLGVFFKGSCSWTPQKTGLVLKEEKHGFLNNTVTVISLKMILPLRHTLLFVFRAPGEYNIDFPLRGSRHGFSVTVTSPPKAEVLKSWDFAEKLWVMVTRVDLVASSKELYVFHKDTGKKEDREKR